MISRRAADGIYERQAVRKEDIWISLVETGRENWSIGASQGE